MVDHFFYLFRANGIKSGTTNLFLIMRCQDFCRRVSKESTSKAKEIWAVMVIQKKSAFIWSDNMISSFSQDHHVSIIMNQFFIDLTLTSMISIPLPLQKTAQLELDGHITLHDCCALWIYIKKKMDTLFAGDIIDRHVAMFHDGPFASKFRLHQLPDSMSFFT